MKLKYYMRGLGIGMVVTAFILSIVLGDNEQTMSDEEVKARAKELGMVESTYLTQISGQKETKESEPETETVPEQEAEPETELQPEQEKEPETELQPEQESKPETETVPEQVIETETQPEQKTEPESEQEPEKETQQEQDIETQEPQIVIITVNPGESSVSVSRSLAAAGLVEDAKEYDRYLCSNGYDKSISIGTYEIPVGATHEEIAKIITKRR